MKLHTDIMLYIYKENLIGSDFKVVCKKLAQHFKISAKQIKNELSFLEKNKRISFSNGKIVKGAKAPENVDKKAQIILENSTKKTAVGTVFKKDNQYIFKSLHDGQIYYVVPTKDIQNCVGKRVCCELNSVNSDTIAVIKQVFGNVADPIEENIAIAYSHGFSDKFPREVMEEVKLIPQEVTAEDLKGRLDLTDKYFMPWDPATCKDKDDAIYAEKTDDGYKVYVAIADVSHYVKDGSKLDEEAMKRGNSCYLGSGVYPMLPKELSNGICSLNDNVSRLSLVAIMNINKYGEIVNYSFKKAVIKIKQSFCYEHVEKVHLCQDGFDQKYSEAKPYVDILYDVADILEEKLKRRNFLRIDSNEPKFQFNETLDEVLAVDPQGKERSHIVVEQLMILANEATAKFFKEHQLDGIYRVHKGISNENVASLNALLAKMGLKYTIKKSVDGIANLLEFVKTCKAKDFLMDAVLKSLSRAKYSSACSYHFGLGSTGYTHFTSPIRRYSDTIAHRIISEYLNGNKILSDGNIELIADHLNDREREANKAEKLSDAFLTSLWAKQHIGEEFEGTIFNITSNSIVIKKDVLLVEIPLEQLNSTGQCYFKLKSSGLKLKDQKSDRTFELGDTIKFTITDVDQSSYIIKAMPILEKQEYLNKEKIYE